VQSQLETDIKIISDIFGDVLSTDGKLLWWGGQECVIQERRLCLFERRGGNQVFKGIQRWKVHRQKRQLYAVGILWFPRLVIRENAWTLGGYFELTWGGRTFIKICVRLELVDLGLFEH
jgi:hypothetical protein